MRLAFTQSGSMLPFISSTFSPSTYARNKDTRIWPGVSGLGLSQGTNQIAAIAAQGAATTGALLAALSPALVAAGPIGAAVAGVIAVGIGIANLFSGCGQTCVMATTVANQLETYWQQNLDHYMSSPVRYRSLQLAALNNFDTGWAALSKACSDPSLGAAGQRCISERQRGGASAWCCNAPNAVQVGNGMCTGCDAFADFRDPIANDPTVVPDPVDATSSTGGLFGGSSSFPMPLLLIGGGILAVSMMGD
jgi:hypothetical protein